MGRMPSVTLRVPGFRTSTDTVAAFRFSSVAQSYASLKQANTRNVGVIGLAIFTERPATPDRRFAEPPPAKVTIVRKWIAAAKRSRFRGDNAWGGSRYCDSWRPLWVADLPCAKRTI